MLGGTNNQQLLERYSEGCSEKTLWDAAMLRCYMCFGVFYFMNGRDHSGMQRQRVLYNGNEPAALIPLC